MADILFSGTRFVPAPPEEIFELLAHPSNHVLIDGSGTLQEAKSTDRLALGAKFGMGMKIGLPYRMVNTVEEFEEGRRIAWCHLGRHRWRYTLTPVEGGTQVNEEFDLSHVPAFRKPVTKFMSRKNGEAIERTLDRLVAHFS